MKRNTSTHTITKLCFLLVLAICILPAEAKSQRRLERERERELRQQERERQRMQWHVRGVNFYGNETYSDKELLHLMELKPKRQSLRYNARFTNSLMNTDLNILRAFYRSTGFEYIDIRLDRVERDSTHRRVWIHILIDEGPRVHVSDVNFDANRFTPRGGTIRRMATQSGEPLILANVRQDSRRLRETLGRRGFLAADVAPFVEIDSAENLAAVTFRIKEGPRAEVGNIKISGGERLRSSVIRRELTFNSGDTLNLRMIQQSERRLYAMGLFNYVHIAPDFDSTRAVLDLPDSTYNVHINVNTSDFFRLQGRAGYSSDEGFIGSASTSYLNMFRLGQSLTLDAKVSQISQSAEVLYTIPLSFLRLPVFDTPILSFLRPLNFDTKVYYERYDNTDLYEGIFRGVRLSIDRQFDRYFLDRSSSFRSFYQLWTQWEQLQWIRVPDVAVQELPDHPIQSIGGNIGLDSRDDLFSPTGGNYFNFDLEVGGLFRKESDKFVKLGFDARHYFSTRSRYFLSTALRTGYIFPYAHSDEVPLQNKFTGGGGNTVRGFPVNKLARTPDGDPLLGNFYTFLNIADMRFPIYRPWQVNGAIFLDAGNVWSDFSEITSAQDFINDLRWSAGPGLRINTPIQLVIRFDMGFKLDKRPGESAWELHFDLGQPF